MPKYVCAFRGRRDSYQVPLALAESHELDQFITDAYAMPWVRTIARATPASVNRHINFRSEAGIPIDRVRCLWGTTALEQIRHKSGFSRLNTWAKLDRNFALAAARRAAQSKADLFLYSSYAWEAFRFRYSHTPRRILFQYHPHPLLEERILSADRRSYSQLFGSAASAPTQTFPEHLLQRERDCWQHADLIFCASTFTKRSLLEAGADEKICRVVPYGIDLPPKIDTQPLQDVFNPVFIGNGMHRKGLHHLLLAWKRADLPPTSKLTLICRLFFDPELEQLARSTSRVELIRGVSAVELQNTFARSTLFVMPSLVEGFGQVYLEALAQGCPVLGTANTSLPDLGDERDGVYLVSPGCIDELIAKLERLSHALPGNSTVRTAARDCARRFPWSRFRHTLCRFLPA